MGFGTFLIGYALLINISYFEYTDLIAALVMTMALYKLYGICRQFRVALFSSVVLCLVGAAELICTLISLFIPAFSIDLLLGYVGPVRYVLIGLISTFAMMGISSLSAEVGLDALEKKSHRSIPFCYVIYSLAAILDFPFLGNFIPTAVLAYTSAIILIAILVLHFVNLFTVYTAYMRICMPEDLRDEEPAPSRFGFVNRFREHEAEREREYAEYKLNKMKKRNNKKRRK